MSVDKKIDGKRRDRKARETHERIAAVALELFLTRGFDETTLEIIADAADISRRTFFHYYSSKEAILETVDKSIHDAFRAALISAPPDQTPMEAVRLALRQMVGRYSGSEAAALDRLMRSTEALRVRKQANYGRQEQALFAALCARWPDPVRRAGLQIVAMIGIGAMRIATDRWRDSTKRRSLVRELDKVFRELKGEVTNILKKA